MFAQLMLSSAIRYDPALCRGENAGEGAQTPVTSFRSYTRHRLFRGFVYPREGRPPS